MKPKSADPLKIAKPPKIKRTLNQSIEDAMGQPDKDKSYGRPNDPTAR